MVKNPPANAGDMGSIPGSLGLEDPLKEDMSTHSSILAMDRGASKLPSTELQRGGCS